jgi:hypothetical protein
MTAPTNKKQLRCFLGMVNFYRDMWRQRSHILAPLTKLTSNKAIFEWTDEQQEAFEEIKRVMCQKTMLLFPDFSKEFHVYTDASNYQLGGVIMQDDKPLAFYSRKLLSAQMNYTTGEKELLSVVEILREFQNILLGHKITVHTDHKNILYRPLPTQRIMRWRMLLEEYNVTFVHVKGVDNVVADGISHLDTDWQNNDDLTHMIPFDESIEINYQVTPYDMAASYMKSKDLSDEDFPMNPCLIAKYQSSDKKLKKEMIDTKGKDFTVKEVEGVSLVHQNDKIRIPSKLQLRITAWYHEYLAHPGEN